ncbi:MAG TPA: protein kinase, partial [Nannocystaceae bacterium]|nr:protein kinase [Nannocystaceae bacterium]
TREWSGPEVVARRFKEEARAASAAGHPNIVEVFDAGRLPDGRLYLVMEYLVGRSLYDEIVAYGRMEVARAMDILREITRAVGAAHAVGIIHRDLKPDNVMLVNKGGEAQVKVLDFGISASADRVAEERRLTQPGHALGTPEYMAPEQAKGKPPNERVDIYALGVMAYEMLAGEPPFVSENFVEVLARKATEPAPPLDRVRDDVPPMLVRLVHDCLEIDPMRRPATTSELLARLDGALSGEDSPVVAIDVVARTKPMEQRGGALVPLGEQRLATIRGPRVEPPTKTWTWIAAVAVLMVGAIALWELRPSTKPPEVEPAAIVQDDATPAQTVSTTTPLVIPVPVDTTPRGEPPAPAPTTAIADATDAKVEPPHDDPVVADPDPPLVVSDDDTKKSGPRPPVVESPECKSNRANADVLRKSREWSALLAKLGVKRCWTGVHRGKGIDLRVKAQFELKRWKECVRDGAAATDPKTKEIVKGCEERLRNTG